MRRLLVLLFTVGCAGHAASPDAASIVEGRASPAALDTIADGATVRVEPGRWIARDRASAGTDFWDGVAALDIASTKRLARTIDERTFALALEALMAGDPDAAAVAFSGLHGTATDRAMRTGSRIGLTMSLSWRSNWSALASIGADPDSASSTDSLALRAGVERWGHALASLPAPVLQVPDVPVTIPMRRSAFGTPVITVSINGKPREFWLDTGASMTMVSTDLARETGVRLAASDTLALGATAGHIPARAVMIDSLSLGSVVVRNLGAALVNASTLRLDRQGGRGGTEQVRIDGVIGTDILRQLDLVLDADAGLLTIGRPRAATHQRRNLFWLGYPIVRLVTRDGRSTLFGLDTGAEGTYVTTSLLRKLPRTRVALRRGSIRGLGTEEQKTEFVARDFALSDGSYAMTLRNVLVAPDRRWTFLALDGIIGADVALGTRLHLDFSNGVLEVLPRERP